MGRGSIHRTSINNFVFGDVVKRHRHRPRIKAHSRRSYSEQFRITRNARVISQRQQAEAGFRFLPDVDTDGHFCFPPSHKLGGDGEHAAKLL